MTDGNAAQIRAIIRQTFDAYQSEQNTKRHRMVGSLPAWFGIVITTLTVVYAAAFLRGDVNSNTRRLDEVELEVRAQSGDNRQIIERMARIEAKLDLVIDGKGQ